MAQRKIMKLVVEIEVPEITEQNVDQEQLITIPIQPLGLACSQNDEDTFDKILRIPNGKNWVNKEDHANKLPLANALEQYDQPNDIPAQMVKKLLEYKSDIEHKSVQAALKKLYDRALLERNEKLMTFVLSISTDMICRSNDPEKTPLSVALANCKSFDDPNMVVVKALLANGAKSSLAVVEIELKKLFIKATQEGNWDGMRFLFSINPELAGELVNLQDAKGDPLLVTLLTFCKRTNDPSAEIIKLFIKHNVNLNHPKITSALVKSLSDVLEDSSLSDDGLQYIKFLLSINSDIANLPDEKGIFPLVKAFTCCRSSVDNCAVAILVLLENNADIKSVTDNPRLKWSVDSFLAYCPGQLKTFASPTKGKYLDRLGYRYELIAKIKPIFQEEMFRLYLLSAQNDYLDSMKKVVFGGTECRFGIGYTENGHGRSLYWLEKYSFLTGQSCIAELSRFSGNIKAVNQFRISTFKIVSKLYEIIPKPLAGKNVQAIILEIQNDLKSAQVLFNKEFSKEALIELYKIKALIARKDNKKDSLELYRKAAALGDLLSAEMGITLAQELKDDTSLRSFFAEAIKAAKVYSYNELASRLQKELETLPAAAVALEVKADKEKEVKDVSLAEPDISQLFEEINVTLRKMRIENEIEVWKHAEIDLNKLFVKFNEEGQDEIIFNLLQPLVSQYKPETCTSVTLENLFNPNPPAIRLRLHAIKTIKTALEDQPDKKAVYAELLYLECFTANFPLQIPAAEKQAQLIKAADLYEALLIKATQEEDWKKGADYSAKIQKLREAIDKGPKPPEAGIILEKKEDVLSQYSAAKIRSDLDKLFSEYFKTQNAEILSNQITQFFAKTFLTLSASEQRVLQEHFIQVIVPKLTSQTAFRPLIPMFFSLEPMNDAVFGFKKEIIKALKSKLAEDKSPTACLKRACLEFYHCQINNHALKLDTKEIDQSRKLQMELSYSCARDSKSDDEIQLAANLLQQLSELKTLDLELEKEVKKKLLNIQYKCYAKNPKEIKSEEHKKELQKYAKASVFPAVFDLFNWLSSENGQGHGINLRFVTIGKKEYIGRRLYLSAKLALLDAEQAALQFPEIAHLRVDRIANHFLEQVRESQEDNLLATWYKLVKNKIIPLMKKGQSPADRAMLQLFNDDLDAFMLKAPEVYGHIEQKQQDSAIKTLKDCIKKNMINAYEDTDWVKQKLRIAETITINPSELDAKAAPAAAAPIPAALRSSRPTTSAERLAAKAREEADLKRAIEESKNSAYPSLAAGASLERKTPAIAAPIPVSITTREPAENEIYRKLYVAVLTLLAGQKSSEHIDAQKILNDYVLKPVTPKDPKFSFYVLASWYSHLVNFIMPAIHRGEDKTPAGQVFNRDRAEFIKLSTESYQNDKLIQASGITLKDIQTHIIPGIKKCQEAYEASHSTLGAEPVVKLFPAPIPAQNPSAPIESPAPGPNGAALYGAGIQSPGVHSLFPSRAEGAPAPAFDFLPGGFIFPAEGVPSPVATTVPAGGKTPSAAAIDEDELMRLFASPEFRL